MADIMQRRKDANGNKTRGATDKMTPGVNKTRCQTVCKKFGLLPKQRRAAVA